MSTLPTCGPQPPSSQKENNFLSLEKIRGFTRTIVQHQGSGNIIHCSKTWISLLSVAVNDQDVPCKCKGSR